MKATVSYSIILVQDSEFQLRNYAFALLLVPVHQLYRRITVCGVPCAGKL